MFCAGNEESPKEWALSPNNQLSTENRVVLAIDLLNLNGDTGSNFGNFAMIAGGMGSGKVFANDGPTGYFFDIDGLKTVATRKMVIAKKVRDEFDSDTETLLANLSDPEQLSKLRDIVADHIGLDDHRLQALLTTVIMSAPDQKTNLILDVTLQHLQQLDNLCRVAKALGYADDRIHLVWLVNDFEVVREEHAARGALEPEILKNVHRGVAATMHDVFSMGKDVRKYMDGQILISLTEVNRHDAESFCVKKSGKDPVQFAEIDKDFRGRIASYVPKGALWE